MYPFGAMPANMCGMKWPTLYLLAIATLAVASHANASSHTAAECREGADFIRNAALSRNNGQPKAAFVERLGGDLAMIRGLPLAARWFARDRSDELLLIGHVERVYDNPLTPESHEAAFLGDCSKNIGDGQAGGMV